MASNKWTIIDTGAASAENIMAFDADLLDKMGQDYNCPVLHLYTFDSPSATFGHFTDPYRFIDQNKAASAGLKLARRPTGGGVIFHLFDLAFSIAVPASHPGYSVNILENYAFVNRIIIETISRYTHNQILPELLPNEPLRGAGASQHFCMAKPTKFDVMFEGKKIAGGAQRRKKNGFLHQGSISLKMPSHDFLRQVLLPDLSLIESMDQTTYPLFSGEPTPEIFDQARADLTRLLKEVVAAMPLE